MAAQDEREPGVVMCNNVLDPMAQKIPKQEQISPQMDPKPEMGAAAAEAAVYDTSPSLLRNPPPILPKRFTRAYPTWPRYAPCWQRWVPT